mgnify:CR=1 FL=1
MATKRRTGAECIGFRYGWNYTDVTDMRYQAARGKIAVYTMFDGYVCCPPTGVKPPDGWAWEQDGETYGRPVYFAKA